MQRKMELEYIGSVGPDGLKIPQSRKLKKELIENFQGKQITITFKESKKSRRHVFNKFYWGLVIRPILAGLRDAGYQTDEIDEESIHNYLKGRFLTKRIANDEGEFLELQGTTRKMTNTQMLEYLDAVIKWASEFLGIIINFPWEALDKEETYNL